MDRRRRRGVVFVASSSLLASTQKRVVVVVVVVRPRAAACSWCSGGRALALAWLVGPRTCALVVEVVGRHKIEPARAFEFRSFRLLCCALHMSERFAACVSFHIFSVFAALVIVIVG